LKFTLRLSSTRSRRNSLSENGSGAATDQAPLQSFQRRLFEQNQRVADIVAVGLGVGRDNFLTRADRRCAQRRALAALMVRARCFMQTIAV